MQAEDWSDSQVFLVMLGSLLETENPLDPSAMPPLNAPTRHFCPAQVLLHSWGTSILVSTLEIFPFLISLPLIYSLLRQLRDQLVTFPGCSKPWLLCLKESIVGFSGSSLAWPQHLQSSLLPFQAPPLFFH